LMGCSKNKTIISRFLDGTLNKGEEKFIQEHMKTCPECRVFYKEVKTLMTRIEIPAEVPTPSYLYARIRNKIETFERQPALIRWLKPVLVPALVGLTFLLAGIGSTLFFRSLADRSGAQTQRSGTDLNLQVFNDAPQSSLAQAYAQITGDRK